jgi:hypothetical protein
VPSRFRAVDAVEAAIAPPRSPAGTRIVRHDNGKKAPRCMPSNRANVGFHTSKLVKTEVRSSSK